MPVLHLTALWEAGSIFTLSAVLLIYIVVSYYLNYRKCAHIKGPWLASFSNLWLLRTTFKGRLYIDCAEALEKYGPLTRIAPDKIVTNDPELWRFMSAPRSTFTKGTWYDSMTLDPHCKNSLAQRDDKEHNKLRAKMIKGYSGKDIPNLEATTDQSITDLITSIRMSAKANKPIDMAQLAQFFTLDVLTTIAFGFPFGYLTTNTDVYNYISEMSSFLGILELASNSPTIQSIMSSKLMSAFSPKPTDKTGMGAMLGVARRVVSARFAADSKPQPDMLGSFIKNGLTPQECEAESMLEILGGSDSTATCIRMIFLYITTHPAVYSKLVTELDAAISQGHISTPVVRSIESQTHLPYLQACIKEGIRLWPPLVGLQGKLPPAGGAVWKGTQLPAGVEIGWNPWSMQRLGSVYGEDAHDFRPERWIEAAAASDRDGGETLGRMTATFELVWGSGKYGCLGKAVALLELDKVFVALFRDFEFGLRDPLCPMKTTCNGVHIQTDLWVTVRERQSVEGKQ